MSTEDETHLAVSVREARAELADLESQAGFWSSVKSVERSANKMRDAELAASRAEGARDALIWVLGLSRRRPGHRVQTDFAAADVHIALSDCPRPHLDGPKAVDAAVLRVAGEVAEINRNAAQDAGALADVLLAECLDEIGVTPANAERRTRDNGLMAPQAEAIVLELGNCAAPINRFGRCELCGAGFPGATALGGGVGGHDERCPWQRAHRWLAVRNADALCVCDHPLSMHAENGHGPCAGADCGCGPGCIHGGFINKDTGEAAPKRSAKVNQPGGRPHGA